MLHLDVSVNFISRMIFYEFESVKLGRSPVV